MRKSTIYFGTLGILITLFAAAWSHAEYQRSRSSERLQRTSQLVKQLDITDLCLFTEARYTRHPSQADLHSAFQDHPLSLEHFPSGSFMPPRKGNWAR